MPRPCGVKIDATTMKPPPFSYHDPRTVSETVELLGRLENAKVLAGGQALMPMLNFRFVQPDHIIDINRVEGLSFIREKNGGLEIRAMTRQRDLEVSDTGRAHWPIMHQAPLTAGHARPATAAPSAARSVISARRRSSFRSQPAMMRR